MINKRTPPSFINPMKLHLVLNAGGMGDIIHVIPAIKKIIKDYPWQNYRIWVPDYLVPLFKKAFKNQFVGPFSKSPEKVDGKKEGILCFNVGRHSSIHVHLTDYAFYMLMDGFAKNDEEKSLPLINPKVNVNKFLIHGDYVCISPYFRNILRQLPARELNKIASYLLARKITPVILGTKQQVYNERTKTSTNGKCVWTPVDGCIDLSEKTSVLETLQLLWGAKALVTMDGGLLHLCCLSKTPVVAGFTSVDPLTRIPYRGGKLMTDQVKVVTPEVSCRYCQTNWHMMYAGQHEFDKCYYEDLQCVKEMTADKFISHLEDIL